MADPLSAFYARQKQYNDIAQADYMNLLKPYNEKEAKTTIAQNVLLPIGAFGVLRVGTNVVKSLRSTKTNSNESVPDDEPETNNNPFDEATYDTEPTSQMELQEIRGTTEATEQGTEASSAETAGEASGETAGTSTGEGVSEAVETSVAEDVGEEAGEFVAEETALGALDAIPGLDIISAIAGIGLAIYNIFHSHHKPKQQAPTQAVLSSTTPSGYQPVSHY